MAPASRMSPSWGSWGKVSRPGSMSSRNREGYRGAVKVPAVRLGQVEALPPPG